MAASATRGTAATAGGKKSLPAKAVGKSKKVNGSTTAKGPKRVPSGSNTAYVMLSYLYGMRQIGQETVSEKDLLLKTNYAHTDSKGYRDAMKRLRDDGHVEKSKGLVSLTGKGKSFAEENGLVDETVQAVTMAEHQARLRDYMVQNANAPQAKVLAVWNVLLDGQLHESKELLQVSGYTSTDSKGYRSIFSWFNKLGLVEKDGKMIRFSDQMYRHGQRPN